MGLVPQGKSPQISFLRPHHRAMARSMITGISPMELARIYDFTPAQITRIINSPLFQAELARLEAQADIVAVDVNRDLQELAIDAVEVISAELHREPEGAKDRKTRTNVAFGVLDRAGYAKREAPILHLHKHEHEHKAREMSTEDLYRDVIDLTEDDYIDELG